MSNDRWAWHRRVATVVVLTVSAAGVVAAQRPSASTDDPPAPPAAAPAAPKQPATPEQPAAPEQPATAAQPATAEPPSPPDKPATAQTMLAEPDAATLETWRKHIEEWEEITPREEADNSFCYVCHLNYETEKLTTIHEAEGVGCETCHGMSGQHSQDEDNVTPPDVMFAREKIAAYCVLCHEKRDLLEGDESHEEFFAGKLAADQTCTNCHEMKHALAVRTRRWNKDTRKLEWSDGVRMMEPQADSAP